MTKEYIAWMQMKARCYNMNATDYSEYGGRGIRVCERWKQSYQSFLSDIGRAPSNHHSIDRIDSNGDYCKNNCRWATASEQANNRRNNRVLTVDGITKNVSQWATAVGVKRGSIYARLNRGWDARRAIYS